jgi:hypothetical protein
MTKDKAVETKEKKPAFDIDKALNNHRFVDFIAHHPDSESLPMDETSGPELERLFTTFESKEIVGKKMKELFRDEIRKNLGVELGAADLQSIDTYLESQAIEDPELMRELLVKVQEYPKMSERIKDKERVLATAAGRGNLDDKKILLDWAADFKGGMGKTRAILTHIPLIKGFALGKEGRDIKDRLASEYKLKLSQVPKEITKIEDAERALQTVREEARRMRELVFNDSEQVQAIFEMARKKAMDLMVDISAGLSRSTATIADVKKAEQFFKKISETAAEDIFDPTGDIGQSRELLRNSFDTVLENNVRDDIMEAVRKPLRAGSAPLTALDRNLKSILSKQEIGSKKGDEAKTFIRETLEEARQQLGSGETAKKILLRRILAQFG